MAHFLPSGYRVLWPLRVSRYRVVKELVNYPGAVKFFGGSGAIRVCQAVQSCLGSKYKKQKNVTNNLPILSVLCGVVLFFSSLDCFVLLCPANSKLNIVFPVNLYLTENLVRD
jgi:hypothetical protein